MNEQAKQKSRKGFLVAFAILSVGCGLCFLLGYSLFVYPEPIVPESAELVDSWYTGPSCCRWLFDEYVVHDMTIDELLAFYEKKRIACDLVEMRNPPYVSIGDSESPDLYSIWRCDYRAGFLDRYGTIHLYDDSEQNVLRIYSKIVVPAP